MTIENRAKAKKDLKTFLTGQLSSSELALLPRAYDVIGDIAVLRLPEQLEGYAGMVAEAVMAVHKNVKSVWQQSGPVAGEYRLRQIRWVSGRKTAETLYKEHGCVFRVDLEQSYFSPRLSHERLRITRLVKPGETVVNMFAGVGCYSIVTAKHSQAAKIYSIDINPAAVKYMEENVRLNRVEDRVVPILGDAREVIERRLREKADRVLMPLPERAYEYIDTALAALKPEGGMLHYYDFEHASKGENPVDKVKAKVSQKLQNLHAPFQVAFARIVRGTGPNWFQVALDVAVERQI